MSSIQIIIASCFWLGMAALLLKAVEKEEGKHSILSKLLFIPLFIYVCIGFIVQLFIPFRDHCCMR